VDHYLARAAHRFGARRYRLTPEARAALAVHDGPGNDRELRNALAAAAFCPRRTGRIDRDDLPTEIAGATGGPAASLPERIETLERHEILLALRRARGNKTVAAQALKVSRKGLLDRLHRLGIE
jgi:transcriptional regulator with PAS, ATPase and Fis domain